MRNDPKSNYAMAENLPALSRAAAAYNGAAVDHRDGSAVTFLISCGDVGAAGTLDAKTQYSDDNSTWTDYVAETNSNEAAITQLTAAGFATLSITNTRGRYSRVVATVGTNAVVFSVTSVLGPLRHIAPA